MCNLGKKNDFSGHPKILLLKQEIKSKTSYELTITVKLLMVN